MPPEVETTAESWTERLWPLLLIAVAALCTVVPLMVQGDSCGHDYNFHLRSWLEAATQWRAGVLRPVWAFHAAWNAGEPRLLFYPPLSWMLGALLEVVLPWRAVPGAFTFLVLLLGGVSMFWLVRRWSSATVAAMAGCLYVANPYMLFVAFERSAYAELLASAWMPMLFGALLTRRVSVVKIALLVALLWLTNAPAAVIASYTVLIVGLTRLLLMQREGGAAQLRYGMQVSAGFLLGLLLDAWYLVPLAAERKYVQLNAALAPMARPDANFLFAHDPDAFHTHVLWQASWIAVLTILIALVCGGVILLARLRARRAHVAESAPSGYGTGRATAALVVYSVVVLFLLSPLSRAVWHVAPQMIFLQFPWRFLAAEGAVAIALLSLLVGHVRWARQRSVAVTFGLGVVLLAAWTGGNRSFRQACSDDETDAAIRGSLLRGEGYEPTDEYTPTKADNDVLKLGLPEAWIASADDADPTPRSRVPVEHLNINDWVMHTALQRDEVSLVIRIRAFRGWRVTVDGAASAAVSNRNDGLTEVSLTAGLPHTVEIDHRAQPEQWEGLALTLLGAVGAALLWRRERRAWVSSREAHGDEFF